jgi:hypothetical protein
VRRGQKRGELPEPIARWERGGWRYGLGDREQMLLLDPTAMRIHFQMGDRAVRTYEPAACDRTTRAPLYHEQQVAAHRATVRRRAPRRPAAQAA